MPILQPTQTPEARLQAAADALLAQAAQDFQTVKVIQAQGVNAFWRHPEFTPEQLAAALGPKAGVLFAAHGKLTTMVMEIAAIDGQPYQPALPTNAFTANPDGTLVIHPTPYVP